MHAREREPMLASRDDARDAPSTSSARSGRAIVVNARRVGVSAFIAVAIVACGAAGVIRRHGGDVTGHTKDEDAPATRARRESPAWETEGGFDFTSLAVEPPWRVTAPPSESFKRLSTLGDGLDDETTLSEVSSGLARMIGQAILDYQQGKELKEYPRALGEELKHKSAQDFQLYKDAMVVKENCANDTQATYSQVAALAKAENAAKPAAPKEVAVAVNAAVAKVDQSANTRADVKAGEGAAAPKAVKGTGSNVQKDYPPKIPGLGAAMSEERRQRLEMNEARREEIRKLRADLLINPDFVADYGQDAFESTIIVGHEVGGVYMAESAQLEGLRFLTSRYISEGQSQNATIPVLGAAAEVKQKEHGGECKILYFYHIPRTGGGTLLSHFGRIGVDVERFERSKYARPDSELAEDQDEDADEHWRRVVGNSLQGGHHVIAHHVGRPGMLEMSEKLSSLRREAASQGCAMRAFTVLREPLKHDLSLVASSRAQSYSEIVNAQTRFLLVNAGNKISRAWPQQLTSENSDLPALLEESTKILEEEFDDVFTLDDIETLTTKINEFFDVGPKQSVPLRASLRHVSDYGIVNKDIAAVREAYESAEEGDWLDKKIFSWAREREHH